VAGLGVLIFDYFLTLGAEVRWTWNRRWNASRVLFVISRYMAFVAAAMTSYAAIATRANENCSHFSQASNGDQYPEQPASYH
jgi:K+-sensing histidine kinase KdpD